MHPNSDQSTVGAGKSGAGAKDRFGPDTTGFWTTVAVAVFLLSPFAAVVYFATAAVAQVRRLRPSRIAFAAAVATCLGILSVGLNPLRGLRWHAEAMWSLCDHLGLVALVQRGLDATTSTVDVDTITLPAGDYGVMSSLLHTLPVAIPVGLWVAWAYAAWITYRRRPLTGLEGDQFDWSRPVGQVDRLRHVRNMRRIAAGKAIGKKGDIPVGLGDYGYIVSVNTAHLQRPTLLFGGPRTGKTRLALNMLAQISTVGGSGVLAIDFKGDEEVPAFWAAFAAAHGRRFKHFKLADKMGGLYQRPHPSAPQHPAYYDPLRSGNATSKTDMLVHSVGREGDAAAYLRSAYDLTQTIYQVAALSGYDRDKGGFQVLEDLLDFENLRTVADSTRADGKGVLADHPGLAKRVDSMIDDLKRDDILRGSVHDMRRTLSTYGNGPAAGPWLRPGPTVDSTIDLYRAVHDGDIVVFSLSVQDYDEIARNIGTLALLDLANAIARLRGDLGTHRARVKDENASPPWAPFYVQIEEFGSAGAEAVLGLLNKGSDVEVRAFLSTQSWHDVVAVDNSGTFAHRILDQAGNTFCFKINEGQAAQVLSETSEQVTKLWPRDRKEFSSGFSGLGVKAANTGTMEVTREHDARQVPAGAFQGLTPHTCLWLRYVPALQATHTFKAGANHWWEEIETVLVPAEVGQEDDSHWSPPDRLSQDHDDPERDPEAQDPPPGWAAPGMTHGGQDGAPQPQRQEKTAGDDAEYAAPTAQTPAGVTGSDRASEEPPLPEPPDTDTPHDETPDKTGTLEQCGSDQKPTVDLDGFDEFR